MGILDSIFAANAQPQQPAPAPTPQPAAMPSSYADLYQRLLGATNANIDAKAPLSGRGLINLLTGRDRTAAAADINVAAPSIWQQFQKAQSDAQNAQLGTAQAYGAASGMTGVPIDPANPMASVPALGKAYGGILNPAPPTAATPSGVTDPLAAQRATLLRLARVSGLMGNAQGASDYLKQANQGLPEGTALLPSGQVVDATSGKPITTDVGTLAAQRAGRVAAAQGAGQQAGVNSQTAVPVVTRGGPGFVRGSELLSSGDKGQTGTDGEYNWLPADSPQYKVIQGQQQKELEESRGDAQQANQGIDTAVQLYNAANQLYTGTGAQTEQSVRKVLGLISQFTGKPVPADIVNSTSKFEQLKYAALNFVQSAARGFSPRAAVQVVKMIQAAKPGDTTSPKGLQDIITKQILPAYMKARASYGATSAYYQNNPLRTDASVKVPNGLPISSFGVKPIQQAQPGDYFVDPHSGNLRQRPVQ